MDRRTWAVDRENELARKFFGIDLASLYNLKWEDEIYNLGYQHIERLPSLEQEREELLEWSHDETESLREYASKRLAKVSGHIAAHLRVLRILRAGLVAEESK